MIQKPKQIHFKSMVITFLFTSLLLGFLFTVIYINKPQGFADCEPSMFYPEYEKCLNGYVSPTVTETISPTPTLLEFPYQSIEEIRTFTREELLTQDRFKAIENITKAMLNLQKVDSVGFSIISSDGDEVKYSYDAKILKDFQQMTLKYQVDNIKFLSTGGGYEIDNMTGSGILAGTYDNKKYMDQGFFDFVFYPDHISLNDCCYDSKKIFHLRDDIPLDVFKVTEFNTGNGIWGVEYLFDYSEGYNTYGHYLIRIGEDGLIYGIHYPNVYGFDEYSRFEYNKEYNIEISLSWENSFPDYVISYPE